MQQMKIEIQKFEIEGFYEDIKKFARTQMNPDLDVTAYLCVVNERGITPDFAEEDPSRDVLDEIINQGKTIFFPFSGPGCEPSIPCADGKSYYEYDEDEEDEDNDGSGLGESDVTGFIVRVADGIIFIDARIHFGGGCGMPPSVCTTDDLGLFDEAMDEYLKRFVKK